MHFYIYLINRIRVIFKSFYKREKKISNLITYLVWKKKINKYKIEIPDFNKKFENLEHKNNTDFLPKKIAVCICFHFKKEKISFLNNICESLASLSQNIDVTVITNEKKPEIIKLLEENIAQRLTNFKIFVPQNIPNIRLLPWYHLPIIKEKIKDKNFTHFMYLEDDISISRENIIYWTKARILLKEFNLIPSFILTEKNINKKIYAVNQKKNKLNTRPRIIINNDICFANPENPYQAMYFYDRELMEEHLYSSSSNPDYGHGAYNISTLNQTMINFDLVAKANVGLAYKSIPEGFFSRYVIPVNSKKKLIQDYCLIKHLPNKYISDKNTYFGKVKIEDVFNK